MIDLLQIWFHSREFQILLLGLFAICCAAGAVAEVFVGSAYTRHQKNVAILGFAVVILVIAGAFVGLFSR